MGFLALTGGLVYSAIGDAGTEPGTVLIHDDVIHGVYDSLGSARAAAGALIETIDVSGGTVLPGLVDCHVHLFFDGGPDMTRTQRSGQHRDPAAAAARAGAYLRAGVTTVRDLGAPVPEVLALRDGIAAGHLAGPRVLAAGPILTVPGGHGAFVGEVVPDPADPVGLTQAVDRLADLGVDCLKIAVSGGVSTPGSDLFAVQFPEPALRAGVAAAHRRGLRIAAHASNPASVAIAAAAGVDSVEHAVLVDDAALAALARHGTVLVPTLAATSQPPAVLDDPRLPAPVREKGRITVAAHRDSIRRAVAAGIAMAGGTDGGSTLTPHALTAREATHLVACGLPPRSALAAVTREGAALLGLADRLGTLAAGKLADLVVVAGDPLADLAALTQVRLVLQGGRVVR